MSNPPSITQADEAYALRVILQAKNAEIERQKNEIAQLKAVLHDKTGQTSAQRNALTTAGPDVWASIRALSERIDRLEGDKP